MCSFSGHPLSMVEATFNKLLAATSKPTKKNKKVSITRLPLKEFKPQIWDTTEPLLEIIIDLSTFHQVSCVASREFTGNPFLQRLFPPCKCETPWSREIQKSRLGSPFFARGETRAGRLAKFTQLWSKNLHDLYTMCLRDQGHSKFKFISTIALFTSFAKQKMS